MKYFVDVICPVCSQEKRLISEVPKEVIHKAIAKSYANTMQKSDLECTHCKSVFEYKYIFEVTIEIGEYSRNPYKITKIGNVPPSPRELSPREEAIRDYTRKYPGLF